MVAVNPFPLVLAPGWAHMAEGRALTLGVFCLVYLKLSGQSSLCPVCTSSCSWLETRVHLSTVDLNYFYCCISYN